MLVEQTVVASLSLILAGRAVARACVSTMWRSQTGTVR